MSRPGEVQCRDVNIGKIEDIIGFTERKSQCDGDFSLSAHRLMADDRYGFPCEIYIVISVAFKKIPQEPLRFI